MFRFIWVKLRYHSRLCAQVNQIIQRAGQLRLGKSKSVVISECRNSIKANNINQLIKVIKTGVA